MSGTIKGGEGGEPLALPLNAAIFDCMLALEKFRSRLSTLVMIISNAELENALQEIQQVAASQANSELGRQPDVHNSERADRPRHVHVDPDSGDERRAGVSPVGKQREPRGTRR